MIGLGSDKNIAAWVCPFLACLFGLYHYTLKTRLILAALALLRSSLRKLAEPDMLLTKPQRRLALSWASIPSLWNFSSRLSERTRSTLLLPRSMGSLTTTFSQKMFSFCGKIGYQHQQSWFNKSPTIKLSVLRSYNAPNRATRPCLKMFQSHKLDQGPVGHIRIIQRYLKQVVQLASWCSIVVCKYL